MDKFATILRADWADVDSNMHMRNSAYVAKSVDARMLFFNQSGFPLSEFQKRGLGPVIKSETVEYFRELRLLEEFQVTVEAAGASQDGSRFRLRNDFVKLDGTLACRVTSTGGWLDIAARRLIAPPEDLLAVMQKAVRTPDFEVLPSSRKGP